MNREELRKNIGQVFKFFPIPRRDSTIGSYESENNQWLLSRECPDKKSFEFSNMIGDYNPLVLDPLKIKNFDAPDILILRGQVILEGSTVRYEPYHPKPASLSGPTASLHLLVEGAEENGVLELPRQSVHKFSFSVANRGQQTVRDYRILILVPLTFTRPPYGFEDLPAPHAHEIGEQKYAMYEKPMLQPIYKDDSIKIGKLLLTIPYDDDIILWQIRCDDGVFPSETTYGEIEIRSTAMSDLVKRAHESLGDKQ